MKRVIFFMALVLVYFTNVFGQEVNTQFIVKNGNTNIGALKYNSNWGLELYTWNNNPISFNFSGTEGLQLKKGRNDDITLLFPVAGKWNRIVTATGASLSFSTGGRGINDDVSDLIITGSGNVGIGLNSPNEKLTVNGNVKVNGNLLIENYGSLQANSGSLEINSVASKPISFKIGNNSNLQMKKGMNGDFTLYFPLSTGGGYWNRIIAANNLSFTAGGRGTNANETDLFIHSSGKIGINNTNPSEKLTVTNGNLKIENGKLFVNVSSNEIAPDVVELFSVFVAGGILSENYSIGPKSTWADYVFNNDYKLPNLREVEYYIKANKHLPDIPTASEIQKKGYSQHEMNIKLLQKIEELTLYSIEQEKEVERLKDNIEIQKSLMDRINDLENKINK